MYSWIRRVAVFSGVAFLTGAIAVPASASGAISIQVTSWQPDLANGTIAYDVTVDGICSASRCSWRLDGLYADGGIEHLQRGIAVGTAYDNYGSPTPFSTRLTGTIPGSAAPEITHLKATMELSTGARLTTDRYPVSAPYPDPSITLTVAKWRIDSNTGYVVYDVSLNARGLGQRFGPCDAIRCSWGIEAYSDDGGTRRIEHSLFSYTNRGNRTWTVTERSTGTGLWAPRVTQLRAYVRPYSCSVPCPYETIETWRPVSRYVYKDHDMARTSDDLGPVLAANGPFFCANVLLQGGTHYERSTLTDQYLACQAAVLAAGGYTIYTVGEAIVDAGGGPMLDLVVEDSKKPYPKPTETALPVPPPQWQEETGCDQVIPESSVYARVGHIEARHGYVFAGDAVNSYWGYGVPWEDLVFPYAMNFKAIPGRELGTCMRVIRYHAPVGYERIYDAPPGQPAFELTSTYTVITESHGGALITAFPGEPNDA